MSKQDSSNRFTITYKTVQNVPIQFDVYPPSFSAGAPTKALPSVVHFHGGGFVVGTRRDFFPAWLQKRINTAGIVFISADYRLMPTGGVTGHEILEDIQDVFAFLRSSKYTIAVDALAAEGQLPCPKFDLDHSKIAVTGGSGGGMLAYFAAAHVRPRPVAVLSLFGMGDLVRPHYLFPKDKPFMSGRPLVDPSKLKEFLHPISSSQIIVESPLAFHPPTATTPAIPANPRMLVSLAYLQLGVYLDYYTGEFEPSLSLTLRAAAEKGATHEELYELIPGRHRPLFPVFHIDENFPPTFFMHGTADTAVPLSESEHLYQLLKKAGGKAGESTIRKPEGQDHFFDIFVPGIEDKFGDTFDEAVEFLKKYLDE
ncbi:hypothetical protein D9758_011563 [Tetrapyrgos nigripes]|uniref:Alpha/beta hydrolase fold-3 domain-containing protein n=1 Tax=Tetrapyrgos nigripes TaxID=182062 RepID=A0A8H5CN96_9AGAR|nr:hypothetical protein D9758_011563 [Tetrapyrgos nigripes]